MASVIAAAAGTPEHISADCALGSHLLSALWAPPAKVNVRDKAPLPSAAVAATTPPVTPLAKFSLVGKSSADPEHVEAARATLKQLLTTLRTQARLITSSTAAATAAATASAAAATAAAAAAIAGADGEGKAGKGSRRKRTAPSSSSSSSSGAAAAATASASAAAVALLPAGAVATVLAVAATGDAGAPRPLMWLWDTLALRLMLPQPAALLAASANVNDNNGANGDSNTPAAGNNNAAPPASAGSASPVRWRCLFLIAAAIVEGLMLAQVRGSLYTTTKPVNCRYITWCIVYFP